MEVKANGEEIKMKFDEMRPILFDGDGLPEINYYSEVAVSVTFETSELIKVLKVVRK